MWCIVLRNIPSQNTMLILLATVRTWNMCVLGLEDGSIMIPWNLRNYTPTDCVTSLRLASLSLPLLEPQTVQAYDGSLHFETLWDYRLRLRFHRNVLSPLSSHVVLLMLPITVVGMSEFLLKTMELVRDLERVGKLHKYFNWRPNLPFIMIRNPSG